MLRMRLTETGEETDFTSRAVASAYKSEIVGAPGKFGYILRSKSGREGWHEIVGEVAAPPVTMKIKPTGRGVTMFGNAGEGDEWFERWFKAEEVARRYAEKRGWLLAA